MLKIIFCLKCLQLLGEFLSFQVLNISLGSQICQEITFFNHLLKLLGTLWAKHQTVLPCGFVFYWSIIAL